MCGYTTGLVFGQDHFTLDKHFIDKGFFTEYFF
jgi:hypothetical protein